MGFGSVHAPIVSAKLVNNVLGLSASLFCHVIETTQLEKMFQSL